MNKIGKKEEENNPVAYAKTVKKEIARKQVKVKSDFMATTQNDKQVKNLMKEAEKPKEAEKIENILSNQISSLSVVFRKKLEEKRKKTMLSTSDINENYDLKHKRLSVSVSRNQNRSILSDGDRIDITPPDLYGDGELPISMNNVNLNEYNGNNPIEPNLLQCLDNSFEIPSSITLRSVSCTSSKRLFLQPSNSSNDGSASNFFATPPNIPA
jgi:hypothetical protein